MENSLNIFLVDDDLFSLNLYRQELENLGHKKLSLYLNGTICLNNLNQKPDIIFLDHNMDDLTGLEVLKKIKRVDPNVFIVILSAQENMKIAIEALKYGAFDYIIKGDHEIKKMQHVIKRIGFLKQEMKRVKSSLFQKLLSIF